MSLAGAERLRTLRRQAGVAAPSPVAPSAAPATDAASAAGLRERTLDELRRLLRVRAPAAPAAPRSLDRTLPGEEVAPGLFRHDAIVPMDPAPALLCGAFDRRDAFALEDVVCFDTETTGLAGGTGTRAFMIGAARWRDGRLHLRQWLMASTSAEPALLEAFGEWLTTATVLASYNGKCYDAPLLATRYRLARMHNPLAGLAHVDLLYPSRRHWRGRWENCRLATIEHRVLGVVREDDLPGSEAPAAWLRFLRGGSAHDLRRVAAHNHQDLVSLARLLVHLSALGAVRAPADGAWSGLPQAAAGQVGSGLRARG